MQKISNVENMNKFLVKEENINVRRYNIKVKIRAKLFDYFKRYEKKNYKERDQSFLVKFLHKIYPVS